MLRWMISSSLLAASVLSAPGLWAQLQDPKQQPGATAITPENPAPTSEKSEGSGTQTSSTRPTPAEIIGANSVAGSRYSNSVLGLSFEIPSGMTAENALTTKQIEDAGHRAAHGSDPASDPVHQAAQARTIHLLSLVDRPASSASSPAQILVLAYDLGSESFSNQEIVANIAAGMSGGPGDWRMTDPPREQQYGGAKFWQEGLKGVVQFGSHSISVYVQILVTQCRGFALAWNLTAGSLERLEALAKSLKTIQFAPECPAANTPR
jgi:hypothetical protein